MGTQKQIILDLTGCKSLGELHQRIRIAFDFPDWYGENWDAFWDLISEPRDYTLVEIRGIKSLTDALMSSGNMVVEILQENKEYQDEFMKKHPQFDYRFDYVIID